MPAAEGVLRARAPHLAVDSAGTGGWHVGAPTHPPMLRAAKARGYDLSALRARQFHAGDFDAFDLILGMDADNMRVIEALRPFGHATPARLLTDHLPGQAADHVPDPYYTRDYEGTLTLIEAAVDGLLARLWNGTRRSDAQTR